MRTILRTVLACLCLYLTAPAHSAPVKMEIAAGEASKALDAFGKLTGLQMFFEHRTVEGRRTRAVSGKLEPAAALALMLEESGLTFEFINEHTVAIRAKKPGEKNSSSRLAPADQMRLAVAEPEGKEDKVGNKEADAQQVVVEGQRERPAPFSTGNLDLTRTEDDVLPFQVFDAKDIELSGAMHLQDFLQNRLPQNFSDVIVDEGRGDGFDYLSGNVDLRGWGAAETVFLLNGRRMPAHYQSTTGDTDNAAPSLLGIPLASIERIEILSSAGSAIYGANATGGVINIVMRRDFKGGQLAVNYETPSDTHAPRPAAGRARRRKSWSRQNATFRHRSAQPIWT